MDSKDEGENVLETARKVTILAERRSLIAQW